MSRKIYQSVNFLRDSLKECKKSISNKGVAVPSTIKVSGLPALIDMIETKPELFDVNIRLPLLVTEPQIIRLVNVKNKNKTYTKTRSDISVSDTVKFTVPQGKYDVYLGNRESDLFKTDNITVGLTTTEYLHSLDLIVVLSEYRKVYSVMLRADNVPDTETTIPAFRAALYIYINIHDLDSLKNPRVFYRTSEDSEYIECTRKTGWYDSVSFEDLKTKSSYAVPILSIDVTNNQWSLGLYELAGVFHPDGRD